ncbi:hypothetical protein [Pantoea stewartii]|uniref:Uncharacterized protein n=2 Tax=Pantoea stewartii TaxID=66269 RepID=H3R8Z6_PANSE|nr:hypothetical protein [Pantoea stewartii]ARF51117.1 hypothetical protein DSJ_18550 [Pantoea stewartii subsp. stewartii DC283]EHU01659.1 hypothetical protein CKS_0093 [Pantoea stewartii subsp. stewartii DC283]KAB0555135.1 hypothetical protein F7Q90_09980 [Pantoea stewartii subsp. stewartii]
MQPDYLSVVMPAFYVQEDGKWIQEQLNGLPASMRHKVATQYAEVYQAAFDAEPTPYRQQNAGRREANTRLRLYVQRYQNAAMGLTEKPALASNHAKPVAAAQIGGDQLAEGWW